MKLTNNIIYNLYMNLTKDYIDSDIYISAKINFYIQKNIAILSAAAEEIEQSRLNIAKHYGQLKKEEGVYEITPDNQEQALKEMKELFSIEQELDIKTFKIEDLGDIQFTSAQMRAIMFMIED